MNKEDKSVDKRREVDGVELRKRKKIV